MKRSEFYIELGERLLHRDMADGHGGLCQRPGQAAFGIARTCAPTSDILNTDIDPFYKDENLPGFFFWLDQYLEEG